MDETFFRDRLRSIDRHTANIKHSFNQLTLHFQRQAQLSSMSPEDLVRHLESLRQSSTAWSVQAYIDQFNEIRTHVNLTEAFTMSCFLTGLRPGIANRVRMYNPTTLHRAFSLALLVEASIHLEQLVSQPPLQFRTHKAASTVDSDPEHNNGDEIVNLARKTNDATVIAVDIVDDDVFNDEATPKQVEVAGRDAPEFIGNEEQLQLTTPILETEQGNCLVPPPTSQNGLDSSYSFDPFLISVPRRVHILVPQFGFRRVSCPVVSNLLHCFGKFGEINDALKVFVIMPLRIYVSCTVSVLDVALFCLWNCCLGWKYNNMSWCCYSRGCVMFVNRRVLLDVVNSPPRDEYEVATYGTVVVITQTTPHESNTNFA